MLVRSTGRKLLTAKVHAMKWPDWMGFGERTYKQPDGEVVVPSKSLWDWLQLLVVPAVLAIAALLYNQAQDNQNRKQAAVANQDTIFQSYLSQMSTLMVSKTWPKHNSSASHVGRVLTLGFLSAMDGARKGEVLQF